MGSRMEGAGSRVLLLGIFLTTTGVLTQFGGPFQPDKKHTIDGEAVNNWASTFGQELWTSLTIATWRDEIQKSYDDGNNLKVERVDGLSMVRDMAYEVQIMMQHKIDAIKRIMELAENIALDHEYENELGKRLKDDLVSYYNAKKLNVLMDDDKETGDEYERYMADYRTRAKGDPYYAQGYSRMVLTANKHFSGIPVNTSHSSVHVPTNVFDGEPKVINAIDWSAKLDGTFHDNYDRDPSLSWQYFGSTTGFLRQYPAMKWLVDENDPDMYDARMRDWYLKTSASPKDIVILLDTSGSMTGLRKEIAKHVVLNIMETLGEDDFVTVLQFSDVTTSLVPCFTDDGDPELVQATTENIAEFTNAVNEIKTMDIANFSSALTSAFVLLEKYKTKKLGAESNQAIMLVTDGVPYKYETIFQEHNHRDKPVRVFTYLIGREISDLDAAKWMACKNNGYFTHVTTLAEVKEQVLKYIPVMARPLVLAREQHPIRWTGVYADIEVPNDRALWVIGLKHPMTRKQLHEAQGKKGNFKGYKLMTSVSIPVYNKKNHTVRIAELLGVAGTDVPIAEIEKLIPPYKLGVNGYSFAINNNGYILYHPDLRPMFQEILKPNYNSVDLTEVELVHDPDHDEPRHNDSTLYRLRKEMVDQGYGEEYLKVKVHMDGMKRVTIKDQEYYYHNISNTPFTLGIAFPSKYGKYRVKGGIELNRNPSVKAAETFSGNKWKIHPDWVYCEYNYARDEDRNFDNPETNLKHFLDRMSKQRDFNWGSSRVRPLPKCQNQGKYEPGCIKSAGIPTAGKNSHFCDKELVQALVLDGEITKVFESDKPRPELFKEFGIELSFVATRSGLTRWEEHKAKSDYEDDPDYYQDPDNLREPHFSEVNNEATDEVWYKRAVEYHYNDPDSFVFSVPFDIGDTRPTLVTATHAVFKEQNGMKAPAAVVGVQIDYDQFRDTFMKVTTSKKIGFGDKMGENLSCKNESIECYVLDNNGFVVISEDPLNTGKFFGEIDGTILQSLEEYSVFNKIKIHDYQAICLESLEEGNPAGIIMTPFRLIAMTFNWIVGQIAMTIIRLELHHIWNPDWTWAVPKPQEPDYVYPYDDDYNEAYEGYDDTQLPEQHQNEAQNADIVSDDTADNEATVEDGSEEQPYEPYNEMAEEIVKEYQEKDGGPIPLLEMTYIKKTQPKPCDKEVYLYELNNTALEMQRPLQGILSNCHTSECERPFSVSMIPKTNLVLVVADKMCPCFSTKISVKPTKVEYDGPQYPSNNSESNYCSLLKSNLYRKKPRDCVSYHPQEEEISLCGSASQLTLPIFLFTSLIILFHL